MLDQVIAGTFAVWQGLHGKITGGTPKEAAKAAVHIHRHAEVLRALVRTKAKLVISDQTMPADRLKITRKTDLKQSEIDDMKRRLKDIGADLVAAEGVAVVREGDE